MIDGTSYDHRQKIEINSPIPEIIATFMNIYPLTGERMLLIPLDLVEQFFDPHESLMYILSRTQTVPSEVHYKVSKVVTYLTSHGIPLESLGIYGSLQSFLTKS